MSKMIDSLGKIFLAECDFTFAALSIAGAEVGEGGGGGGGYLKESS